MSEGDQRESISRRLPDDSQDRGQKRSSDGDGDVEDQRESILRRLPDEDGQPAPTGVPQRFGPDMAGAVDGRKAKTCEMKLDGRKVVTCEMKPDRRKVKWNADVEEFKFLAAWGGAKRDMAVIRQKLGCEHDVSEFYSPPRVVKMVRHFGMREVACRLI